MFVKWIRDVDTGELYPIKNDFDYETPAHLETPEYMTIDYDKTKKMTIEQLQNQLIAAQNHIEAIENEKTSDNNFTATVNDVSSEIVSSLKHEKSNSFDFLASLKFVGLILLACIVCAMGIYVFSQENGIEINIPNFSEQQTVDYEVSPFYEIGSIPIYSSEQGIALYLNRKEQDQPQERQETEQDQSESYTENNFIQLLENNLLSVLPILIFVLVSCSVIRLLFKFFHSL